MKAHLKSKTIRFGIVTILVALFNMFAPMLGLAEKPVAEMTWKELSERQGSQAQGITNTLTLIGGGGAIYGRSVAKGKIGGDDV